MELNISRSNKVVAMRITEKGFIKKEIWLTPEQAIAKGNELIFLGKYIKGGWAGKEEDFKIATETIRS